jgi:ribose 5-phosphate isomerase A
MSSGHQDHNQEKELAARKAVAEVQDGMVVGVGTGSTVAFAIVALAARVRAGLRIQTVATSLRTEELIRDAGMNVLEFSGLDTVDLCIDGVDEIDGSFRAIKGGGGAMLREKIVANAARRMIAIADSSKVVDQIGKALLPVEVLPFALSFVASQIGERGGKPTVRQRLGGGCYLTDQGNAVLDCAFGQINEPVGLSESLSAIPGVLGHGLFIDEVDALYVGRSAIVETMERPTSSR